MREIRGRLRLADTVRVANIWMLTDADGRHWLVDSGHPIERHRLAGALRRAGVDRLAGVLLTHRHSDHAGNAAWLRDRFRCPVACHAEDAPFLEGREAPPRLARGRGIHPFQWLCRIEDRWPARCPVDETFTPGRWRGDWEIVHVPGHTEGSSMLYHAPTRTLFSGDVLLAGIAPLRSLVRLGLAVDAFSLDVERCRAAARAWLAACPPVEALCAGHGPPIVGDLQGRLRRFAGG